MHDGICSRDVTTIQGGVERANVTIVGTTGGGLS